MQTERPLILVTNDDSYKSTGIEALIEMVQPFGRVVAVAPHTVQSGMSHAITITSPLRIRHHRSENNFDLYSVTGTPVDCVKLAINQLLPRMPDLLVSGINHGSNSAASVLYSGTIGATLEGCLYGIPSIGFSILDYKETPDFAASIKYGREIVRNVLANGLATGCCLNVNIPKLPLAEVKGIKVARQSHGVWREKYDKRTDPHGFDYYWLTGHFENNEPESTDTDEWALANGYISVVPTQPDLTHHAEIGTLKGLDGITICQKM